MLLSSAPQPDCSQVGLHQEKVCEQVWKTTAFKSLIVDDQSMSCLRASLLDSLPWCLRCEGVGMWLPIDMVCRSRKYKLQCRLYGRTTAGFSLSVVSFWQVLACMGDRRLRSGTSHTCLKYRTNTQFADLLQGCLLRLYDVRSQCSDVRYQISEMCYAIWQTSNDRL